MTLDPAANPPHVGLMTRPSDTMAPGAASPGISWRRDALVAFVGDGPAEGGASP
jgi:hypothetical protein